MFRTLVLLLLAAGLIIILFASAGASPQAANANAAGASAAGGSADSSSAAESVAAAEPAAQMQGTSIYVVRQGDTLSSIARRFCMTTTELYSLNSGVLNNPNQIYPGMQLRVVNRCGGGGGGGGAWGVCDRGPSTHAQGTVSGNRYFVVRGDTSYSIASRFGISVTALCQANGINPWHIFAGQTLIIPGLTGSCGGCQPGWNCPQPCPPGNWNCPQPCQPGWSCPQPCQPGWNCPVTPGPTVIPVTPVPTAIAPFIAVDQPRNGQTLPATFTVSGRGGGLFEGNVVVTAQTADGVVRAQQSTTLQGANVGSGGQGTFSVQLTVVVPTQMSGWIIVSSPQSRVNPVWVSVWFAAGGGGGGNIQTREYVSGLCNVTVIAGQPFVSTPGGPATGTFSASTTLAATRGAKDVNQPGSFWFLVTPALNAPSVWAPISSTSSLSSGCYW